MIVTPGAQCFLFSARWYHSAKSPGLKSRAVNSVVVWGRLPEAPAGPTCCREQGWRSPNCFSCTLIISIVAPRLSSNLYFCCANLVSPRGFKGVVHECRYPGNTAFPPTLLPILPPQAGGSVTQSGRVIFVSLVFYRKVRPHSQPVNSDFLSVLSLPLYKVLSLHRRLDRKAVATVTVSSQTPAVRQTPHTLIHKLARISNRIIPKTHKPTSRTHCHTN